jgi:hypothetical protein
MMIGIPYRRWILQKWEYKILKVSAQPGTKGALKGFSNIIVGEIDDKEIPDWINKKWTLIQALNEFGKQGWELVVFAVGGVPLTAPSTYTMKRPIEE